MSLVSSKTKPKSARTHSLILTAACGAGIAAFAGLLPASKGVAVAMTATRLIDIQANELR
jgi:hypothetical protein